MVANLQWGVRRRRTNKGRDECGASLISTRQKIIQQTCVSHLLKIQHMPAWTAATNCRATLVRATVGGAAEGQDVLFTPQAAGLGGGGELHCSNWALVQLTEGGGGKGSEWGSQKMSGGGNYYCICQNKVWLLKEWRGANNKKSRNTERLNCCAVNGSCYFTRNIPHDIHDGSHADKKSPAASGAGIKTDKGSVPFSAI